MLANRGIRCEQPRLLLIFKSLCDVQRWLDSTVGSHSWLPALVVAISGDAFFNVPMHECNVRVETRLLLHRPDYYLRLLPTNLYTFRVSYRGRGHVGGKQLWSSTVGSRIAIILAATWAPPPPCGVSVAIIDLNTFFLDQPQAGALSTLTPSLLFIFGTFCDETKSDYIGNIPKLSSCS